MTARKRGSKEKGTQRKRRYHTAVESGPVHVEVKERSISRKLAQEAKMTAVVAAEAAEKTRRKNTEAARAGRRSRAKPREPSEKPACSFCQCSLLRCFFV